MLWNEWYYYRTLLTKITMPFWRLWRKEGCEKSDTATKFYCLAAPKHKTGDSQQENKKCNP
jgi:hypothetical protein